MVELQRHQDFPGDFFCTRFRVRGQNLIPVEEALAEHYELPAYELTRMITAREATAEAVVASVLGRIEEKDGQIKAYLAIHRDEALKTARKIDRRIAQGEPVGPLAGIPVGVKDAICTRGLETTCGSRILEGFIPPYDA
ncbi:uncharacterized protein METZ01_LOCUS320889, partial [marine metagenome]